MILTESYTKNEIEKLGNAIIFLCERMDKVTKTHLLKLVFIIEEISIAKFGIPFFDLKFNVWKLGPVSTDLFADLSDEPVLLANYIQKVDNMYFKPKMAFSDNEFNDNEIELLSTIADRFKYCTSSELVNHTHKKDSPWYKAAVKNGILEQLENGQIPTTQIEINMGEIVEEDENKSAIYKGHKEYLSQSKNLKS
jgi:uncharacterized phage-associated protein